MSPCGRHQIRLVHPTVFPKPGIVPGSLPVEDPCNRETFDKNVLREKISMSEVDFCLRGEAAEQLGHVFLFAEIEEYAAVIVEVFLDARKCMRRVPRVGHEPIVVGTTRDGPERCPRV